MPHTDIFVFFLGVYPLFAAWKRRCYRCFSMPVLINWIFFVLFIKSRLVFKAGLNTVRQMGVISWFGLGGGGQRFGKDCIIYIATRNNCDHGRSLCLLRVKQRCRQCNCAARLNHKLKPLKCRRHGPQRFGFSDNNPWPAKSLHNRKGQFARLWCDNRVTKATSQSCIALDLAAGKRSGRVVKTFGFARAGSQSRCCRFKC